jgi:hypothetical protein
VEANDAKRGGEGGVGGGRARDALVPARAVCAAAVCPVADGYARRVEARGVKRRAELLDKAAAPRALIVDADEVEGKPVR